MLIHTTIWMNLENIRLSERSLSLSGAQRKCSPRCNRPVRNLFYHKQSYLLRHVICQLLLGYPGDRARKLKRRFSCRSWTGINPFALRYMLNSSLSTNLDSIHLSLSDFHLINLWINQYYLCQKAFFCFCFFLCISSTCHLLSVNWKTNCEDIDYQSGYFRHCQCIDFSLISIRALYIQLSDQRCVHLTKDVLRCKVLKY